MTSTADQIRAAATRNTTLLTGLHETDSAPTQLAQQSSYIHDLDAQITITTKRVSTLKDSTASELKDHEKYRDSHLRRFAHKASGRKEKFAEKAAKEEREYFEAIQAQKAAEDELAYLQQLRADAEGKRQSYDAAAKKHTDLQRQLDALYNSIFAGHTPQFPAEDAAEETANAAAASLAQANQILEHERHVLYLLGQTNLKLSETRRHLDGARSMSQWDMFSSGTMASMQKRNLLERAESCLQQVRMLQSQLAQVAPGMPLLGELKVSVGNIWSDVVFDNVWTDMQMHDRIKESEVKVDAAGEKIAGLVREAEGREGRGREECQRKEEKLRRARVELQRVREEAFRCVLEGGMGASVASDEAPPAYEFAK